MFNSFVIIVLKYINIVQYFEYCTTQAPDWLPILTRQSSDSILRHGIIPVGLEIPITVPDGTGDAEIVIGQLR